MSQIQEIQTTSIITPSKLPDANFVINPYIWCLHGCKYCYANFMRKFSGHLRDERWKFVDVKINAVETIKNLKKYDWKTIVIWSVTDPYQKIEEKYCITRNILEKIIWIKAKINILTKSDIIVRDIDILSKFQDLEVTVSMWTIDENIKTILEPWSPSIKSRIEALKKLDKAWIKTSLFISPILPYITDWKKIIELVGDNVSGIWFENLNLYWSIKQNIYEFLAKVDSSLIEKYKDIYESWKNNNYWFDIENEIKQYCTSKNLKYKIYFHHKENKKD